MQVKKYHSPKEYLDAAKSEKTSVEELEFLASSEYDFVRSAVAENINTTPDILDLLVPETLDSWNRQDIAAILIENPKTTSDTLRNLARKIIHFAHSGRDNDNAVRACAKLFSNPNTPLESIQMLLDSDQITTLVLKKIANDTARTDVLNLLVEHKSEAVRKRALKKLETLK